MSTPTALWRLRETPDHIDTAYQQARATRLARERAQRRRTFTITDGWRQRPGVSTTGSHQWGTEDDE